MSAIRSISCPKCNAKLKFDPDKITAEVTRCMCPGCKTVLRLRKSVREQEKDAASDRDEGGIKPQTPVGEAEQAGRELDDLARRFEGEMGFDDVTEPGTSGAPDVQEQDAGATETESPEDREDAGADEAKGHAERKYKRVKFKKKVLVNNQIMVEALDISEDGLFLHTGRSFDDGAVVEVGIPTMPGNFDLKVQAMVKHNHRGIGMGLQFIEIGGEEKKQLQELIAQLDDAALKELEGRKKILLVGGTDTARNINKSKLVLDGFYVMQATTAEEVFKILQEEPPDAMVLEWQETKFNCKGLLARIKENAGYAAIARVVLSTLTDASIQKEIMAAGAHKAMAKMDTNPAKLSSVLKQLIAERDG